MTDFNLEVLFKAKISEAKQEFSLRLEQQRLFDIQNMFLKTLHTEVKKSNHCASEVIENLSRKYEGTYQRLHETGRTYEDIIAEKIVIDTYSSLEKFLSECFFTIYFCFPKFLGESKTIPITELFIDGDIELCKRHIIEQEVKSLIQSNNIIKTLENFDKKFDIKNIKPLSDGEDAKALLEIAWVRNIIIHNNGRINQVYIYDVNKILGSSKYHFSIGDSVLEKIDDVVDDIKRISGKICEDLENLLLNDFVRLKNYHDSKK